MKPQLEKNAHTYPQKTGKGSVGLTRAIDTAACSFMKITSKTDAQNLILNIWKRFIAVYDFTSEESKIAAYNAVKNMAHKKIEENGFKGVIPAADKLADAFYNSANGTSEETEDTSAPTEETPAENTPKEESGKPSTPKEGETDNASKPKEKPEKEETPQTPSDDSSKGDGKKENPAPDPKKNPPKEDTSADNKAKEKKSMSKIAASVISFLAGAAIVSVIWWLILAGFGMQDNTADRTQGSANSDVAVTLGTNKAVASDMVAYSAEEFLMLDSEKSKITICRDTNKNVGYNIQLNMSREVFTDDNGKQYLCYTGTSANALVEIVVPIHPEGSNASRYSMSFDEAVGRRDVQFSKVEIGWNGNDATITILCTGQVYYLTR